MGHSLQIPLQFFWSEVNFPARAEKWSSFERFLYVMQHYSIAHLKYISLNLFKVFPIKITRMGGGSSVFVHPNLKVDQKTLQSLQEFENECISRNLNTEQIYDLLIQRYESLVGSSLEVLRNQEQVIVCKDEIHDHDLKQDDVSSMTKFPIPELKKRKSIKKIEKLSYETTSSRARRISSASISPKRKSSRSPKSFGSSSSSVASSFSSSERLAPPSPKMIQSTSSNSVKVGKTFGGSKTTYRNSSPLLETSSLDTSSSILSSKKGELTNSSRLLTPTKSHSLKLLANTTSKINNNRRTRSSQEPVISLTRSDRSNSIDSTETFIPSHTIDSAWNLPRTASLDEMTVIFSDNEGEDDDDDDSTVHQEASHPRVLSPPIHSSTSTTTTTTTTCSLTGELKHKLSMIPEQSELYECQLCQKKFGSHDLLETHLTFSQLHKQAVFKMRYKYEQAYQEADQLGILLKKTIDSFQLALINKKSYYEGKLTCSQLRWKQAIGKIISKFATEKIENIMEEMYGSKKNHQRYLNMWKPKVLPQIISIYSCSKFFWRAKCRFQLFIFYHESANCLEIVPFLLPSKPPSIEDAMKSSNTHNTVKMAPRIYLDVSVLEDYHVNHRCRLHHEDDVQSTNQQYNHLNTSNTTTTNCFVTSSGPLTTVIPSTSSSASCDFHHQLHHQYLTRHPDEYSFHPPRSSFVKDLLYYLKIDHEKILSQSIAPEHALSFDDSIYDHLAVISPPLKVKHFTPAVVQILQEIPIVSHNDIQQKLEEVKQHQQALSYAVSRAESIAANVRILHRTNSKNNNSNSQSIKSPQPSPSASSSNNNHKGNNHSWQNPKHPRFSEEKICY
jgi:hypothetical protein